MGRVYTFTCPRCEYRARVSGGREEGFHCATETLACRDCRALHDVAVRVRVTEAAAAGAPQSKLLPPAGETSPPMLLFGQPPRRVWRELPLRCPVAPEHRVERWRAPGKCPRCGAFLERDVMPFRVWD